MSKGLRIRALTGLILISICILSLICSGWVSENALAKKDDPTVAVAFTADNLIRLHVLANSDNDHDQRVKLLVRNRILNETERIINVHDTKEALALLRKNRRKLQRAAVDELRKNGYGYPAAIQIGRFDFPEKEYSFGLMPAGEYNALRVVLGEGRGGNWWCILFPPVCHLSVEEKPKNQNEQIILKWKAMEDLLVNKEEFMTMAWNDWVRLFQLATISSTENFSPIGVEIK